MQHTLQKMNLVFFSMTGITALLTAAETLQSTDHGEAERLGPVTAKLYIERGAADCTKQDWKEGITNFSEAIRLNPKDPLPYDWRGGAYCAILDWNKAISDFTQAIQLAPTNARVYLNRANAYRARHNIERAISDLTECLRINPKDANAHATRGACLCEKRQFERAVLDYKEAIRLDPRNPLPYNGIGWLRATCPVPAMRDGNEGIEFAKKACELTAWRQWQYVDTLAATFAESGDFKQALKYQKQAMEMNGVGDNERKVMRRRLSLYEGQQSYREE